MSKQTMPAKTAGTASAKKQADLMYLGPTISGVVTHSTVFRNGVLSENVKKRIDELPMMKKLFIELDKIPEARKELYKKQSALSAIYSQVENTGGMKNGV